jgi:leader peptidase (prepilin peptidase) / N-methyltransferase
MHDPVLLSLVFLFGISFGSFFNVLIYRLPNEMSLSKPSSHCPKCKHKIRFYENVPILSFIFLRGRCSNCKTRISWRYPLVEALGGILSVISIYHFGFSIRGFETALLSLIFIPIFFIDLEHRIIPNSLDLPWIPIGLICSIFAGAIVDWLGSAIGIIVGGGLFFLVMKLGEVAFKKEAMGFGDVKLAAMLGAFMGWKNILLILVIGSFLGSVVGVTIILLSKKSGKSTYIPFGPFLVLASLIALYYGDAIIKAYRAFAGI